MSALSASRLCLFVLTIGGVFARDHEARAQTTETIAIRGHTQSLRLYGPRAGTPVIVSSGDGGWMHLGPHVAEVLAARGFFVVGFDARAYLKSFTSGKVTLRAEDEPGDYKVLADYASRRAIGKGLRDRPPRFRPQMAGARHQTRCFDLTVPRRGRSMVRHSTA